MYCERHLCLVYAWRDAVSYHAVNRMRCKPGASTALVKTALEQTEMTVKNILKTKSLHVPTVRPDAMIGDVIDALEADDIGALIVSMDGNRIDGIISERDVVRGLQQNGMKVLSQAVRELMTPDVITCTATDRVAYVMGLMDAENIRHVPVVSEGVIVGIVSSRDIIKLRLDEVQSEAEAMRHYISAA